MNVDMVAEHEHPAVPNIVRKQSYHTPDQIEAIGLSDS